MEKLKIIVVGAGVIGRKHVPLVRNNPECELVAIVDPAPTAAKFAEDEGVAYFHNLDKCLETLRPDGAIIATPNALHVSHTLACINHGIPILVEKPIADTVETATQIVEAAEHAGVPLLVGHHRRFNPILQKAREMIASGALGQIVVITGTALFFKPDNYFEEGMWRKAPGGGPILINLIHAIDDMRFMCGEISAISTFSSSEMRGFAVEDTAVVNLRFANGALGNFVISDTVASVRSWEHTTGENPIYPNYPDEDCYYVAGDLASLSIPTMRVTRFEGDRSWFEPVKRDIVNVDHDDAYQRQLESFVRVIRDEELPVVTGRDALKTLEVTLAAACSAKKGTIWFDAQAE